ncbi:MAG: hypothetical protein V3U22_03050 [Vicinamibacteria bacterium]
MRLTFTLLVAIVSFACVAPTPSGLEMYVEATHDTFTRSEGYTTGVRVYFDLNRPDGDSNLADWCYEGDPCWGEHR